MLIIEGTDGVGKTMLCRELLKHLPGWEYVHFGLLPPDWDYYHGYIECMKRNDGRLVVDRFYQSEIAYGTCLRDTHHIREQALIEAHMTMVPAFRVLITANPAWLREHFNPRTQDFTLADALQVNMWFMNWDYPWDVHQHCYSWPSTEGILNRYLERWEHVHALQRQTG